MSQIEKDAGALGIAVVAALPLCLDNEGQTPFALGTNCVVYRAPYGRERPFDVSLGARHFLVQTVDAEPHAVAAAHAGT